MNYWVSLNDAAGHPVQLAKAHREGGTTAAALSVTYTFSGVYAPHGFHLRDLHGKTAAETIPELGRAIAALGTTEPTEDYWQPTPGNAGYVLAELLSWAKEHPQGVWEVVR